MGLLDTENHIPAALACCLISTENKLVYIADRRTLAMGSVVHMKAAMLLAWACDYEMQRNINTLGTMQRSWIFSIARPFQSYLSPIR